jgi:predicted Zn-dependent protease
MSSLRQRYGISAQAIEAGFLDLASLLDRSLRAGESYTARFAAETSDFVRFNRGRVRQPGSVEQRYLDIDLIAGERHATQALALTGEPAVDRERVAGAVSALRETLADVADDPHLLIATDVASSRDVRGGPLPPAEDIVAAVVAHADGLDLVGIYAGGPVYRGFANSFGQRNWHAVTTFHLEWSLFERTDKAVKSTLSGLAWAPEQFAIRMAEARERLAYLGRPAKTLPPGSYRAFLAPAAVAEIAGLLCWGGFSARALATRQSPLMRMHDVTDGAPRLAPMVNITEAPVDGVAPRFQGEGFARPTSTPLIRAGQLVGSLVSPRTAREFALAANGANASETPEALAMAGGALDSADALAELGEGLYISNLWYLNYSDRPAGRITGMTRFATFWVEAGRIVAPVDVLRFDDTVYRMLGTNLEALTRETELLLDSATYRERQLASMRLPGALLGSLQFTL